MEEEDMLSIKVSSHLVQVYDTGNTSTRLSTISIGSRRFCLGTCDPPLPCGIQNERTGRLGNSELLSNSRYVLTVRRAGKHAALNWRLDRNTTGVESSSKVPGAR